MINLSHLELKNFFSHANTSLPLTDYKGLVLIEGVNSSGYYASNGSGKSTLLEGIVYALTGNTLRGVSVNDIVNRNHKKDTKASLKFSNGADEYVVSRYRKDDNFGDSIILYKGEENISKRVNKETQKSLDDVLGISYDVLVSTMLLGEGLSSRFTQLSDPDKKALIESTLNLNYDMNSIRSKASSELSKLKLEKATLEGKISALKEISSFDVEEAQELVYNHDAQAAQAFESAEALKLRVSAIDSERASLSSKLDILRNSINQYDRVISEIGRLESEKSENERILSSIDQQQICRCTVCNQALSTPESRKSIKDNYSNKIAELSNKISELSTHLSSLPDKSILEEKYNSISQELESINSKITESNQLINSYNSMYWENKAESDKLKAEILRAAESTFDMNSIEESIKSIDEDIIKYEYFYKLFSPTGLIVNILSDAIEYINTRLATYSGVLLEKDYKINFVKGKISLVDSTGASYQSLSNGEKRRLDISIQFALHDYCMKYCNISLDTMFIDEILDTLDDVGTENIITVLRMKLDYCNLKRIFVISHNDELKSYFDEIITVRKEENGDSYLV